MHARISFFQLVKGANMDAAVKGFNDSIPTVQDIDGNRGFMLLTDRSIGRAITITLWDSEASLYSTREQTDRVREQMAGTSGLWIQGVEHYEVVRDER